MPIYEYYCGRCDKRFETLVLGNEKPECPTCGGKQVKRLLSTCAFVSKGSGGETVSASAGSSSCTGCSSSSCEGCGG